MDTLSSIFFEAFRTTPEKKILTIQYSNQADDSLTYHDLFQQASICAYFLSKNSIEPNQLVIIILEHGQALVGAFWGCILHGAVPSIMPFLTEKLSPEHYRRSLQALFEVSTPSAIITYRAFSDEIYKAIQNIKTPPCILIVEDIFENGYEPAQPHELLGLTYSRENDIVLLQHSSGSTGLQKGVALSNRAIINQLDNYRSAIHLSHQDVIVSWLPLYHDMGLIAGFLMPILSQVHLVLMSPFDWVRAPYRLFRSISKFNGTLVWLPNFAYNFCSQKIRDRELENVNLSSLRAVINCSEPMYLKSHQQFLDRFSQYGLKPTAIATCYAMAENVFAVTQDGIDKPVTVDEIDQKAMIVEKIAIPTHVTSNSIRMLSAGRPIENTKVKIVDESGIELPERNIGEISLQSNCMLSEYYKRPEETKNSFLNGWFLTGDLGYITNGEIFITGRKKDLIIVGGKNIYPQDLERLVDDIPGLHPGRVVAFGVYNQLAGTEDVIIIAESGLEKEDERNTLIEQIRQQISHGSDITLRQAIIVERGWLLKTSSGKISRSANREKYLSLTL